MKKKTHLLTTLILIGVIVSVGLMSFSCKPKSIKLNKNEVVLGLGDSETLVASIEPSGSKNNNVVWTSSNPLIVSVVNGVITGEAGGEAVITASSVAVPSLSDSCKVKVVPSLSIRSKDITISNLSFTGFSYKLFSGEQDFLAKVLKAFPVGTDLAFSDLVVTALSIPDDSFLKDLSLFSVGNPLPAGVFGVEKMGSGVPEQTFSKRFSFTLSAKGVDIPFTYINDDANDFFTLPKEGEISLVAGDFEVTSMIGDKMKIRLKDLQKKIIAAYSAGSETGVGNFTFTVKSEKLAAPVTVTDSISDSIEAIVDATSGSTSYQFSFELTVTLSSGKTPTITNNVVLEHTHVKIVNLPVNPLFVSIARLSEENGQPLPQATALLNYGAELEVALIELLGGKANYRSWDFDRATWSAEVYDKTDGKVAEIKNAPYKKRTAFDLPLDRVYEVQLVDAQIMVPQDNPDLSGTLLVNMDWNSEQFWGEYITIRHEADFPTTIYFDDNNVKTSAVTGKKYKLVFGDDFNYHFNGLNYKSYALYNAVKEKENLDPEAYRYNKNWDPEGDAPYKRKDISSWDLRNAETKNGILLSKVLHQDPGTGVVHLGYNKTKPLEGFQDLLAEVEGLTGCTRSKTVRFGYIEGRVRVKKKAFNSNALKGPWYAFWLHGAMHEYDIMEFTGNTAKESELVIHWHNGWGSFGKNPGSSWIKYNVPDNYEEEWWTLGLYWDENEVVYTYNGAEMLRLKKESAIKVKLATKSPAWFAPGYGPSRIINETTRFNQNVNPEIGGGTTPIPYGSNTLKPIMDVPMNIFASTELAPSGWGGNFLNAWDKLPTWLEVDYIAYYLPE